MKRALAFLKKLGRYVSIGVFLFFLAVGFASDVYPAHRVLDQHLGVLTAGKRFNFVSWEVNALADKAWQFIRGAPVDDQAAQQVRDFFALAAEIQALRGQAERLSRQEPFPEEELAAIEARLNSLYQQRDGMEDRVEDVLAAQVSQALEDLELHSHILWWDPVWPPVTSEFVDLPLLLVVSPRDRIARRADIYLVPDLTVAEMEAIEDAVYDLNYSGLVTHIGGLSTYPAMIPETYGLGFVLHTMPHEWVHDFLAFYPLGWHYGASGELTTMNETVADIVGQEVGQWVARHYYPEYVREPQPEPTAPSEPSEPAEPPAFDFGAYMRETRLRVDDLLAEGKVEEAEAYMEQRRQGLEEHGYFIRKLNQAYFAFHGSYATGAISVDPIGPQLKGLRRTSSSLREFLFSVAYMDSYDDLLRVVGTPTPTP
jgi:hypothetical protein